MALQLPVLAALSACAREAAERDEPFVTLTAGEGAAMAALASLIIPSDDLPGAEEAGAVYFVDRALEGPFAGMLVPIRDGLADLDQRARQVDPTSAGFSGLPYDRQADIVRAIERDEFFFLARMLTVMGVFADPSYGGNRGGAGERILGYEVHGAYQPPFGWYDAEVARGGGAA